MGEGGSGGGESARGREGWETRKKKSGQSRSEGRRKSGRNRKAKEEIIRLAEEEEQAKQGRMGQQKERVYRRGRVKLAERKRETTGRTVAGDRKAVAHQRRTEGGGDSGESGWDSK